MADKAYIIISNWNNWKDTLECLESVFQSTYPSWQVIVRDNASTDGSTHRIATWATERSVPCVTLDRDEAAGGAQNADVAENPLIIIQSGGNLGWAGGNNIALRYVLAMGDAKYVWFLNNDLVVDKDALSELVKLAKADEKTAMVSSKLLYYDRPDTLQTAGGSWIVPWMGNPVVIAGNEPDDGKWDKPFEPDYLSGASFLAKTEALKSVGLFDENYFLYWEDADIGLRMRRAERRILYCPRSRVLHKEGGTLGYMSPQADYYWVRNGLYFTRKFYPHYLVIIPFAYFAKHTLLRSLKRQPHNFMSYVRGLLDFIRGYTGMFPG